MQGTLKQGTLKVYPARAYVRARARARVRVRVRVRACVPSAAAVAIQLQPFCHAENQLGRVVTQGTLRDNSAKLIFRMAKGLQLNCHSRLALLPVTAP